VSAIAVIGSVAFAVLRLPFGALPDRVRRARRRGPSPRDGGGTRAQAATPAVLTSTVLTSTALTSPALNIRIAAHNAQIV
jgi:hypothetical protein